MTHYRVQALHESGEPLVVRWVPIEHLQTTLVGLGEDPSLSAPEAIPEDSPPPAGRPDLIASFELDPR